MIEITDRPERIEAFLPLLDGMVQEGMMTLEKVRIIAYRPDGGLAVGSAGDLDRGGATEGDR